MLLRIAIARAVAAVLVLAGGWSPLPAAEQPKEAPLRAAIGEVPPFGIQEADGSWRGIGIDLWRDIARLRGYEYALLPMPFKGVLPSLEAGRVDVAVGAVIWLSERRRNLAQFGGSPAQGLGHGVWWAAVTMTTVGYGDKAPITLGGWVVAVLWMFAALVMVSGFTAAVASVLTVGSLQGGIDGPEDLRRDHVATVAGTDSARYLDGERIRSTAYPDTRSAMESVQRGETDAFVYDAPILQFRNAELDRGGLRLLPGTFDPQVYAFAVGSGSPLREPIGESILRITNSPGWPAMQRRYLGAAVQ